jgi:hypothetical protein
MENISVNPSVTLSDVTRASYFCGIAIVRWSLALREEHR